MDTPDNKWITDWKCGVDAAREKELGNEFVQVFSAFWNDADLESKSKSTKNRYYSALHCLGGYLIEQGVYEEKELTAHELLMSEIDQYEGPLIHHNNEAWQKELDTVCKKLFKYMVKNK